MKEKQLRQEEVKFLICPCPRFQTSSRGGLTLSLLCYPPHAPSSCLRLVPETPLISASLSFSPLVASSSVALNLWQALSLSLRKFLILPRSWLVKTHSHNLSWFSIIPLCCFSFFASKSFLLLKKRRTLRARESQQRKKNYSSNL